MISLQTRYAAIAFACGLVIALQCCVDARAQDGRMASLKTDSRSAYEEVLVVASELISRQALDEVAERRKATCGVRLCRILLVDNVQVLRESSVRIYDLSVETKLRQMQERVANSGPIAEWVDIPGVLRFKRIRTSRGEIVKEGSFADPRVGKMFSVVSVAAVRSDHVDGGLSLLLTMTDRMSKTLAEMILDGVFRSLDLGSVEITIRIRHDVAFLDDEGLIAFEPFVTEKLPTADEYNKRREIVCRRRSGETFSCFVQ